uniref:Uncharacterized protein n=1 Tax=Vespula pensylvanica TaxID=30213 RepID=A0A834UDR2_VESPE|nr:hypothetical protein H0235_005226 [Vespula pensylvanica]
MFPNMSEKRKADAKFGNLPGLGEARGSCQDLCPFSVISDDSSDIFGASHGISDTRYSLDTRRTTREPVFRNDGGVAEEFESQPSALAAESGT